jgi:biopolymer transport protein ExbB
MVISRHTLTWATALLLASLAALTRAQAPESPVPPPLAPPATVTVAPAPAPDAAPAPVAETPGSGTAAGAGLTRAYGMSWREAWHYGGSIMWFILALSILGGALVIYFLFILRPTQVAPRLLLSELRDRLNDGDMNAARRACEQRACPLSSVTLAALDYIRGVPATEVPLLKDIVEAEGSRQAENLQSQTQFLLDISVITPMLGLLGTVLGMLKAFGSIAQDMEAAKPVILAQGVSQAIITTIFGLIVAIPCMVFYAYFRRRVSRMVSLLELAATEIMTLLITRPRA